MDNGKPVDKERSPIFLLFLDVIHQILLQLGDYFEFNQNLLLFLADNTWSGRFGTFMFDTEYQKLENDAKNRSVSIWTHILHRKNISEFTNKNYREKKESLRINSHVRYLEIWEEFFNRRDYDRLPTSKSKYYY